MSKQPVRFPLMAHRGYASMYPENTLEALCAAGNAGITLLEFDVQLTRDHFPVLLHDAGLKRTAGVDRLVCQSTLAELQTVGVGFPAQFGDSYQNIRLPTLEQGLELLPAHPDWVYFIELKHESIEAFGIELVVDQLLPLIYEHLDQCVIISFDYKCLLEVCRRSDVHVGWVLKQYDEVSQQQAEALDPDYLFVNCLRLPELGTPLWPGAWRWVSYEAVDAGHARALYARGVDIVSSMAAPELKRELAHSYKADARDTPLG
jgi:glycerophosphoryl diester phosphodiesterase